MTGDRGGPSAVQDQLDRVAQRFNGPVCVTALDVRSGERVTHRGERRVPTASVIKVAILCQAYEHLMSLGEPPQVVLSIKERHRVGGSGVIKLTPSMTSLSFIDLATLMIAVSDNTATNVLMDWSGGPDAVNEFTARLGLSETEVHNYISADSARKGVRSFAESTTNDLCALGELVGGVGNTFPWSLSVLNIMAHQQYRDLVPRYWNLETTADLLGIEDAGTRVCSKTGFFPGVRSEMGVVEATGRPALIYAVVAESGDTSMGPDAAPALACGLVGYALATGWLRDVEGIAVVDGAARTPRDPTAE